MNDISAKPKNFLDPVKEAKAVAAIREGFAGMGDDADLLRDTAEGETSLFEAIDRVLASIQEHTIQIEGLKAVEASLSARRLRCEESVKRERAVLEQALTIAGLSSVVRPTATLSLASRPPGLTVTEESDIPARFWKPGAPTLDRKALTEAVRLHAEAVAAGDAQAVAENPPIPGATLSNGAPSLTIRVK